MTTTSEVVYSLYNSLIMYIDFKAAQFRYEIEVLEGVTLHST